MLRLARGYWCAEIVIVSSVLSELSHLCGRPRQSRAGSEFEDANIVRHTSMFMRCVFTSNARVCECRDCKGFHMARAKCEVVSVRRSVLQVAQYVQNLAIHQVPGV